ncbi:MAG: DUF438 domain-containing protein [Agathobacter sp.]|nr:DUF438 domain-containing protein [Agathobacter sp.]
MKTEITGRIKEYLKRLGQGEDLELVRADFVKEFESVDAAEIMAAEQQLIEAGTPITEVQRLCDVHAAFFHGKNSSENFAEAERKFAASVKEQKLAVTAELVKTEGHPLYTFTKENEELERRIKVCQKAIADGTLSRADVDAIRLLATHYAKKGDLLYPVLKVVHGISGPSDVMWTVDDEIRDEISALLKDAKPGDEAWNKRLEAVLKRADDMIYKEANILFPNCALHFTKEEWYGIYRDSKDYEESFGVENARWEEAEQAKREVVSVLENEKIVLAGGSMTVEELEAVLNTIPLEITFVDISDTNRYFNAGTKVFKRPEMAIGREVYSCHPPKIEQQVRKIIGGFKDGSLDRVPVWMDKNGRTMLVTYLAVRNQKGQYLGTLELVQDMEFAKEHFKDKKF